MNYRSGIAIVLSNTTTRMNSNSNAVPGLKSKKRFAARLRKLRWSIYHAENRTDVHGLLNKYKKLVGEFLGKFELRLKSHEVGIWKKKLSQTVKDVNSPQKTYTKVNSIWYNRAKNVQHPQMLKQDVMSMPETMNKLDAILVKLMEIESVLNGYENSKKLCGNVILDAREDKIGDVHTTNVALTDLDVDPRGDYGTARNASKDVASKKGKITLVKEVSNGDDNSVVDQDILPTESTRFGQACIRVLSVLDNNPVEKFDAKDASKNALDCLYLVEIWRELQESRMEMPRCLEQKVGEYLINAVNQLEDMKVKTAGERELIDVATTGMKNCIRCYF